MNTIQNVMEALGVETRTKRKGSLLHDLLTTLIATLNAISICQGEKSIVFDS